MASIFTIETERRELAFARHYVAHHDGLLPRDRFWSVVVARFDNAVATGHLARFRFYHPRITPLLLRDHDLRHRPAAIVVPVAPERPVMPGPPPVVGPVEVPGVTVPVPVPSPGGAAAVPTPTSAVLLAVGLATALVAGRLRRRLAT